MSLRDHVQQVGRARSVGSKHRRAYESRREERQVGPIGGIGGPGHDARVDLAVEERSDEREPPRCLDPLGTHDVDERLGLPQLRDRHLDQSALRRLQPQRVEEALHRLAIGIDLRRRLSAQLAQVARAHDVVGGEPPVGDEDAQGVGRSALHVKEHEVLETVLFVAG